MLKHNQTNALANEMKHHTEAAFVIFMSRPCLTQKLLTLKLIKPREYETVCHIHNYFPSKIYLCKVITKTRRQHTWQKVGHTFPSVDMPQLSIWLL